MLLPDDEQVFAYTRTLDGTTLLVVANLCADVVTVDLGAEAQLAEGSVLIATHPADGPSRSGTEVTLRPWESWATISG